MGRKRDGMETHDKKWKGPLKGRSCTDWFCMIIFLGIVVGWAVIGYYAYVNGDVIRLITPTDSEGRKCGLDEDVTDRPYLVFFDLTKCMNVSVINSRCDTPQVCVENCPTDNFVWTVNSTLLMNDLETLRNSMICKIEVNLTSATYDEMATYVSNDVCATWYLNSTSWTGRCIPNGVPELFINLTLTLDELSEASSFVKLLVEIEEIVTNAYSDFLETRYLVLSILGCGALVSLIYILLLRWLATPIIFLSIVALIALLVFSTYQCYVLYAVAYSTWWLTFTIISAIMLAIVLLVSIFLRTRIRLACQLIGESSKAVTSTTSTLLFPLIPWILQLLIIAYGFVVTIYVLTLRDQQYTVQLGGNCVCDESLGYENGTICSSSTFAANCFEDNATCISGGCYLTSTTTPWFSNYMHGYTVVAFFWILFFISAFGEMVLAGTFATWYWTFKKSNVPFFTLTGAVWRTLRYHIGTLAFGSLIITICRLVRLVLEWIDTKLKSYDNELAQFFLKCMKCYFWLLEKFLKFINKNAYIMCAIHGKGFCYSARTAFSLLMRNILRVFVLDKVTDWLLFLGKILVTGSVAWASWWHITETYTDINYWMVPVILIAVGTYLVATVFFNVYSMAVDTLFLCFLEDSEVNDGTPEKPYYMSKGLMKILRKS